jgi:hypothetical protein
MTAFPMTLTRLNEFAAADTMTFADTGMGGLVAVVAVWGGYRSYLTVEAAEQRLAELTRAGWRVTWMGPAEGSLWRSAFDADAHR